MGRALADALEGDLDVVLVHKVGSPHQPELAIGAVDEHGHVVLDALAGELGMPAAAAQAIAEREAEGLRARRAALGVPPADPAGRVVIIVDDGIATGATVMAAIRYRDAEASRTASSSPRRSRLPTRCTVSSARRTTSSACWCRPDFQAVGQYYDDFSPVSDEEVAAALAPRTA